MAPKTCLPVFIFLMSVTIHLTFVASQSLEAVNCANNGNYTSGSPYRADLNTLLRSLSSNISNSVFYNASVGEANAMALCRADIQLATCRGCVNTVSDQILRRCPEQVQAIMWQQLCMVRYTKESIFRILANEPYAYLYSLDRPEATQFNEVRGALIDDLCAAVANGSAPRKAAAGNTTTPDNAATIYAIVQCTPDLSPENCATCLADAVRGMSRCCSNRAWVTFYKPSCTIRFDYRSLDVNMTRLQEPLEPLSSPSSLPPPSSSRPPAGKNDDNTTRNISIIVVPIVGFVIVASCVGLFARKRMKQKKKGEPTIGEDGNEIISVESVQHDFGEIKAATVESIQYDFGEIKAATVESIQYDFGEIKAATDDFSDGNKLGQGGFGTVYKGKLENGQEIAVKRLSRDLGQGDLEFKNEVLLLAQLQHRNLVKLLGFSLEGTERLLVYEFVKNGSLDHFIFDPVKSSDLDWDKRYKIIGGIARGLLYLHQDSRLQIIHRDLKASNVLLDEEMNPKISDFGIAKLAVPDKTHVRTNRIVGTYGYLAPEYAFHGHFSFKSDVYSFGVLVLEIVTGKKQIYLQNEENTGDQNEENSGDLITHAWRSWREGASANMIDHGLTANSGAQQNMQRCIHIALLCVQQNPKDRPTMASVGLMLNSLSATLPLPSKPGFYVPSDFTKASDSQGPEYNSSQMEPSGSSKNLLDQPANSSGRDSSITKLHPR